MVEVYEAIKLLGPCTVPEVIGTLGWKRGWVLTLLGTLVKSGFVVKTPGVFSTDATFDVVAERVIPTIELGKTEAERRRVADAMTSIMKTTTQSARTTADAGALEIDAKLRNFTCYYELGYLTPEQFSKVRALVKQITEIMALGKGQRKGRLYLATMLSFPIVPKQRASTTPKAGASRRRKGGTPLR